MAIRPAAADFPAASALLAAAAALASGACARRPAASSSSATVQSTKQAACFGAAAEVLVSDAPYARELRLAGERLYWTHGPKGYAMSQMDLATSRVEHRPGKYLQLDTMDARQSFWTTNVNDLEVADLVTMKVSVLVPGQDRMEDPIVWSSLAIDDTYVYYGRDAYPPLHDAGLFRMRRDGAGKEERIAPSPGLDQPFVAGAGFVYWFDLHQEKAALLRRALTPGVPEQVVAWLPSYDPKAFKALAGARLYFVDRGALWSVPVDGSAPPVRQLALGNAKVAELIVEPPCLYFVSDGRIKRAALDAEPSQTPETIADGETFSGGDVVSDGRFLYWVDFKRTRIMRAGPSRDVVPPRDERVAKPAPEQPRRPVRPSMLALADGWGCVHVGRPSPARSSWECWKTAGAGTAIAAKPVSKLMGFMVAAERDRVCLPVGSEPRCWRWDQLMDGAPADFPEKAVEHPKMTLALGGSFTCTVEAQTWRCSGDNRYGQLANGAGGDGAEQGVHNYHADRGVLGDWHGCHVRAHAGTYCWGRGDAGQLGFPATDTCKVGGRNVPCSTKPRRLPLADQPSYPFHVLKAGDMFTCGGTNRLVCWGGSRDGVFGTADECPADLRRAWPTLTGSVAAPKATCARAPVDVPGFAEPKRDYNYLSFDVGARGICAIVNGELRCAGAIPTPKLPAKALYFAIQRGDQPAACASTDRDVYCWGAGYSPANDPAAPVRIELAAHSEKRSGAPIFDSPPRKGGWAANCAANFACEVETQPLPACAANADAGATAWGELAARAARLAKQTIKVRGPLVLGPDEESGCYVGEPCCHGTHRRAMAIGGAEGKLALDGFWCAGDGSRLCCNRPAYGQQVIATGKLVDADGRWQLKPAEVCLAGGR
jgi:hypothetical protein